jgi:hypothetical protein
MMREKKKRDGWEIDIITNGTKSGIWCGVRVFEIKKRELFVYYLLCCYFFNVCHSFVGCISLPYIDEYCVWVYSVFFYLR